MLLLRELFFKTKRQNGQNKKGDNSKLVLGRVMVLVTALLVALNLKFKFHVIPNSFYKFLFKQVNLNKGN